MEISAWKQLLCLLARVARGRSAVADLGLRCFGRAFALASPALPERGKEGRDILDPFGNQVGGGAVALDPPGDAKPPPGNHGAGAICRCVS